MLKFNCAIVWMLLYLVLFIAAYGGKSEMQMWQFVSATTPLFLAFIVELVSFVRGLYANLKHQ